MDVVLIAIAKTGFVLLSKISSKLLTPSRNDLIKMLKDDLAHFASQAWSAIVFEFFRDIEALWMQPILALCITLHRMNVYWLVTFIRIEVDPPALQIKNCGHGILDDFRRLLFGP